MRPLLLLITALFISSCNQATNYQPSNKENLANEVTEKTAAQINKKTGLYPCGSGGQMMHQIKMLALSFDYYQSIDIKKGRELLIAAVDEFVVAVNADEHIRPYLNNYPFGPQNIEIRIFLRNPDGSSIAPGQLCVMGALEGVLDYDIRDPETDRLKTVHKETYEEALKALQTTSLKTSPTPTPQAP